MKLLKMLGLAALMAVAVTALLGTGSASAVENKTVLCKNETTPCNSVYPTNTKIVSKSASPELKVTVFGFIEAVIDCPESKVEGVTTVEKGQPQLSGTITSLTFGPATQCREDVFDTECNVEVVQLPYSALISHTANTQNGSLEAFGPNENSQPGARVECEELGVNCIYKVNETGQAGATSKVGKLTVTGGEQPPPGPTVTANQVVLKEVPVDPENPECTGSNPRWSAVYHVEEPTKGWVSFVSQ